MKVTVVGGGSTYTPELVDGLARLRDRLLVDELVLMDPQKDRLGPVAAMATRILAGHGHPGRVSTTRELDAAVDGADAVLLQLRVGGQAARQRDETWPLDCGCVGQETTGAGGLAKALRTVPVVLDIAARVRQRSPEAWLVDFTNPVGIVTRALLAEGHRAVGLCNVAIGVQRYVGGLLDVPPEHVRLDHVGLNHLTWVRGVRVGTSDRDLLPDLLAGQADQLAAHLALPAGVLRLTGTLPSYYLRYYYAHHTVVEEQRRSPSRAEEVAAIERRLLDMYADPAVTTKPALLEQRGGAYYSEAAVALLGALLGSDDSEPVQVANVRNGGTLPFLPADAVVEVPCHVDGTGARPLPTPTLDPQLAGLVGHVSAYEELALEAALHGGRDRVVAALLAHPLVGQWELAGGLADRLLSANTDYLPWAP
jgi:6-phospho-beta-glucosidase